MKHKHTPEEQRRLIVQGTRHLIAVGGMNNFSFPKLMEETGINAPAVYELYKNKEDLLTSCYLDIDREIALLLERALKRVPPHRDQVEAIYDYCWALWGAYWDYLMEDPERTLFYWRFYSSRYYTNAIVSIRSRNFQAFFSFVENLDTRFHVSEKNNRQVLAGNLIDGTLSGAVKVITGGYPNDDLTVGTIYRTVFQPVFTVLGCFPAAMQKEVQPMTDKEFKRLGRAELVDIIFELQKRCDEYDAQIEALRQERAKKELCLSQSGSIAEAALRINGVFEAAQAAADQYLDSVHAANENIEARTAEAERQSAQILEAARKQAEEMLADADRKARQIEAEANEHAQDAWTQFQQKANDLLRAHEELNVFMKKDS